MVFAVACDKIEKKIIITKSKILHLSNTVTSKILSQVTKHKAKK